jgi:beta-alanine degradation protein BauB
VKFSTANSVEFSLVARTAQHRKVNGPPTSVRARLQPYTNTKVAASTPLLPAPCGEAAGKRLRAIESPERLLQSKLTIFFVKWSKLVNGTRPYRNRSTTVQSLFENDRVRVLRYKDSPGDRTKPHQHPDSVLITLSNFRRTLTVGDRTVDVEKSPHEVIWNVVQTHVGENTGTTETDVIFVELK